MKNIKVVFASIDNDAYIVFDGSKYPKFSHLIINSLLSKSEIYQVKKRALKEIDERNKAIERLKRHEELADMKIEK